VVPELLPKAVPQSVSKGGAPIMVPESGCKALVWGKMITTDSGTMIGAPLWALLWALIRAPLWAPIWAHVLGISWGIPAAVLGHVAGLPPPKKKIIEKNEK